MPKNGDTKVMYPGNDPENGPAETHTWIGHYWVSASELADNRKAWAERVYAHATAHYNDKDMHWDCVVECWSQKELIEVIVEYQMLRYEDVLDYFRSYARMMYEQDLNQRYE